MFEKSDSNIKESIVEIKKKKRKTLLTKIANSTLKQLGLKEVKKEVIDQKLQNIADLPVREGIGDTMLPLVLALIEISHQTVSDMNLALAYTVEQSFQYRKMILGSKECVGFFARCGRDQVISQSQEHMKSLLAIQ